MWKKVSLNVLLWLIAELAKDENNNGIPDIFERSE